jgi:hypothetical protein
MFKIFKSFFTRDASRTASGNVLHEAQEKAEATYSPDPPYLKDIFEFPLHTELETRLWWNMRGLKGIRELLDRNRTNDAETVCEKLLKVYPDHYVLYVWLADIELQRGRRIAAKRRCIEGLAVSKQRHVLCGKLGDIEYRCRNLDEAVKWWIRSILMQRRIRPRVDDARSPLYLSYVATALEKPGCSRMLKSMADSGEHGVISLRREAQQQLYAMAKQCGTKAMGDAIVFLTDRANWDSSLPDRAALDKERAQTPAEEIIPDLKEIDSQLIRLSEARGENKDRFQRLAADIDVAQCVSEIGYVLTLIYGRAREVVFIRGPFHAQSIIVYQDGIGIDLGWGSHFPNLTFGYEGQGTWLMHNFLLGSGFSLEAQNHPGSGETAPNSVDLTKVVPPLLLKKDGRRMQGVIAGNAITWPNGTTTYVGDAR